MDWSEYRCGVVEEEIMMGWLSDHNSHSLRSFVALPKEPRLGRSLHAEQQERRCVSVVCMGGRSRLESAPVVAQGRFSVQNEAK